MADKKAKPIVPIMDHLNIAEFNRGQSSRLLRELVEADKTAYIQKNGKPMAVVMSFERYQRLCKEGIDINEY
jgi:PHD/YefM family antitoxin component YafN of YafNO toxin-antitoxin module